MRTLREGTQWEPSGMGLSGNPQGGDVRTLREGTQWEPSGMGLSGNPQGGDSVRTLREATQ